MITVIIPALNESGVIGRTVERLNAVPDRHKISQIIVVDGGSRDNTVHEARERGAIVVESKSKGRAVQMNTGAKAATADILFFLHADSLPPDSFVNDISRAVKDGFTSGCYRLRFDIDHWFLRANSWFTRFDINAFRFGDQGLFVTKSTFLKTGGFCEKHILMEDQEIIGRLKKHGRFAVIPKDITTSARKYAANGIFRTQVVFYLIYFMYKLGYSQQKLLHVFRRLLHQDRL